MVAELNPDRKSRQWRPVRLVPVERVSGCGRRCGSGALQVVLGRVSQIAQDADAIESRLPLFPPTPLPYHYYQYLVSSAPLPYMSSTLSPTVPSSSPAASTPINKDNAAADKDALLATSTPASPTLKDVRAFEHERQRMKKAADLVKMRARKGRWTSSLPKGELYNSSRKSTVPLFSEKEKLLRADDVDPLDGSLVTDTRTELDGVPTRNVSNAPEVKLSDLVAFPTRTKSRKGLDGDFVVIPPNRHVIVLDDIVSHDLLIDDGWEHIHGVDDEPVMTKQSYADVLSAQPR
ncbi:hypothetical protein FB45DRAFT_289682 [Roridomyces roridus]|uniref:Uncharacterized protein n=1 Tax=Roridomyces roridus TaxID=1738132 RepID=A0AAD7CB21_9AGAR|nr:hypothetical protein FB45DRAFT_289682 [Roridomyces roridus]